MHVYLAHLNIQRQIHIFVLIYYKMVTLFLVEQLKAENCIFCNEFARYVHNDFEVNKTWTTQKSRFFWMVSEVFLQLIRMVGRY